MKAVLISIQPRWCELIASGKKTVEVRKTKPKLESPFICYIYQTRKTWVYDIYSRIADWQGKVIGEFVCDEIKGITADNLVAVYFNNPQENTCLNDLEMRRYADGKTLFLWHISNLVIYDKPKELSEFRLYYVRAYYDEELKLPMPTHKISRPPQSWCYVERLGEG